MNDVQRYTKPDSNMRLLVEHLVATVSTFLYVNVPHTCSGPFCLSQSQSSNSNYHFYIVAFFSQPSPCIASSTYCFTSQNSHDSFCLADKSLSDHTTCQCSAPVDNDLGQGTICMGATTIARTSLLIHRLIRIMARPSTRNLMKAPSSKSHEAHVRRCRTFLILDDNKASNHSKYHDRNFLHTSQDRTIGKSHFKFSSRLRE